MHFWNFIFRVHSLTLPAVMWTNIRPKDKNKSYCLLLLHTTSEGHGHILRVMTLKTNVDGWQQTDSSKQMKLHCLVVPYVMHVKSIMMKIEYWVLKQAMSVESMYKHLELGTYIPGPHASSTFKFKFQQKKTSKLEVNYF